MSIIIFGVFTCTQNPLFGCTYYIKEFYFHIQLTMHMFPKISNNKGKIIGHVPLTQVNSVQGSLKMPFFFITELGLIFFDHS